MAGWGGGNADNLYAQSQLATMTPEQQRQCPDARTLMGRSSAAPLRSGWGAMSNAMSPIMGALMMRCGQQAQSKPWQQAPQAGS
jgi:hypothetical protein